MAITFASSFSIFAVLAYASAFKFNFDVLHQLLVVTLLAFEIDALVVLFELLFQGLISLNLLPE